MNEPCPGLQEGRHEERVSLSTDIWLREVLLSLLVTTGETSWIKRDLTWYNLPRFNHRISGGYRVKPARQTRTRRPSCTVLLRDNYLKKQTWLRYSLNNYLRIRRCICFLSSLKLPKQDVHLLLTRSTRHSQSVCYPSHVLTANTAIFSCKVGASETKLYWGQINSTSHLLQTAAYWHTVSVI